MVRCEVEEFSMHGATFGSYVRPGSGSRQLCAWRVSVAAGVAGQEHRVSHEEVFLVLAGTPTLQLDGEQQRLGPGDVVLAPAGCSLRLDNEGDGPAELWVTAPVGLQGRLADGSVVTPPWTR